MNKLDISKISKQIKEYGVFSQKNIFDKNEFELISNQLKNLTKKEKKIYFPINFKDYLFKILKIDFDKIILKKKLVELADKLDFSKIAAESLGDNVYLEDLDCYLSKKSKDTILEWHNDIGYKFNSMNAKKDFLEKAKSTVYNQKTKKSSMGIKFFIYITDVKSNDGALGIIPYSHKVVYALTNLILEKKIELKTYWKLKDLRNIILQDENKKHFLDYIDKSELERFIEKTQFVETSAEETLEFDFALNKNSAVIFDEMAVHRGSAPTYNDRLVLRYLYRRKL